MAKEQEIICIMCPMSCLVAITADDKGNVLSVSNNQCHEGKKYATAEYKFPGRILTTTLLTEYSMRKLLPVKSNRPIPKERLMEAIYSISEVKVRPPVKLGQVIVPDILETGADLVATDELTSQE